LIENARALSLRPDATPACGGTPAIIMSFSGIPTCKGGAQSDRWQQPNSDVRMLSTDGWGMERHTGQHRWPPICVRPRLTRRSMRPTLGEAIL